MPVKVLERLWISLLILLRFYTLSGSFWGNMLILYLIRYRNEKIIYLYP